MATPVNIILGIKNNNACMKVVESMKTPEFAGLFPPEYKLGRIATTNLREELDESISGGEYNVAVVLEVMENDKIGQGAIKAWRKLNPECRVILLMDNARKCSIKTNLLYKAEYYDGLFVEDINILNLAEMCKHGRDKDGAYAYYGLADFVFEDKKAKSAQPVETVAQIDEPIVESIPEPVIAEIPIPVDDTPADEVEPPLDTSLQEYSEDTLKEDTEIGLVPVEDSALDVSDEIQPVKETLDTVPSEDEMVISSDIPFDATADMEGDSDELDPSFFEERAQFSTTTRSKSEGKSKLPTIYKAKASSERRSLDQILKNPGSIKSYLSKKEKEVLSRKKHEGKEPSYMDILFFTVYQAFAKQYMVAFDDVAIGKMSLDDFELKLYPYIEGVQASADDKQSVLEAFESFVTGYDVLEPLLADPAVTEIHVLDANKVRVKKGGQRLNTDVFFYGEGRYERFCDQLILKNRHNLTADGITKVFTDTVFSDQFFIQVSITDKNVSTDKSTAITLRKTLKSKLLLADLLEQGHITDVQAASILHTIGSDKGIIVCGPPSSGKTTLMNAMLEHIPDVKNGIVLQYRDELIAGTHPELTIQHPVMESDDTVGVDMTHLAKGALLLDVDYIVFGDIKGGEAKQFYTAATSGYIVWAGITAMSAMDAIEKVCMYTNESDRILNVLSDKIGLIVYMDEWDVREVLFVDGIDGNGKISFRQT